MKTRIFTILIMAIGLLASTSAFAQPTSPVSTQSITAKDGSTVTYSVTVPGSGTFTWALSGGASVTDYSSETGNSIEITWDAATAGQTYNLDVYYVDGTTGCYSELYRYAITIEAIELNIVDAITETCSWLATDGVKGNPTALAANDVIEFALTLDQANGATSPITVNYTVTGGSGTDTRSEDVTFTGTGGTLNVAIDSYFANTSGSNTDFTITITSVVDANSNPLTNGSGNTATIVVHSVPTLTFDN